MALFGKQGWRPVTKLDFLVSKIYKVRYYSASNFLNASISSNPNYIWRNGEIFSKPGRC